MKPINCATLKIPLFDARFLAYIIASLFVTPGITKSKQ